MDMPKTSAIKSKNWCKLNYKIISIMYKILDLRLETSYKLFSPKNVKIFFDRFQWFTTNFGKYEGQFSVNNATIFKQLSKCFLHSSINLL